MVVKHVRSEVNLLVDSLSRLDFDRFWANTHPDTNSEPDDFTYLMSVWPMERFWNNSDSYLPSF